MKLQLLSLQTDGVLFFEGIEESFAEELALTLDEDPENVAVTLRFLEAQQMLIQREDGGYILPEAQGLIGTEGVLLDVCGVSGEKTFGHFVTVVLRQVTRKRHNMLVMLYQVT